MQTIADCTVMSKTAAACTDGAPNGNPPEEQAHRKLNPWNVREQLGSLEAMRKYDEYIREHTRRLRQLYKEARGEMSPSGEWYQER